MQLMRVLRRCCAETSRGGLALLILAALVLGLPGCVSPVPRSGTDAASTGPPIPAGQTRRILYITPGRPELPSPTLDAFREGLGAIGLSEANGVQLEVRYSADGDAEIAALAASAVALQPDVIVAVGTPRVEAVRKATSTIPIVMLNVSDPVESGLIASLSRPGGNITGMSTSSGAHAAKRLETLKEALPQVRRVAALTTPRWQEPGTSASRQWAETQSAAQALGILVEIAEVRPGANVDETSERVTAAMVEAKGRGVDALTVLGDALFDRFRPQVAKVMLQIELPTIHLRADFVDDGGLMAYGPDVFAQARQAGRITEKVIRGVSPAEIPVEQPVAFELAINLQTAAKLNLNLSPAVVDQATRIVR